MNIPIDENLFNQIVDKLNVKVEKIIAKNLEIGRFVFSGIASDKPVLVKIFAQQNKGSISKSKKEIEVEELLCQFELQHKVRFNRARILSHGEQAEYFWIIREYYEGDSLANYENDYSKKPFLFKYDRIQDKYLAKRTTIIDQINANISVLRLFKPEDQQRSCYDNRFLADPSSYDIIAAEKAFGFTLTKQLDFFNKNKDNFFNKNNTSASIGDLVPPNIIIGVSDKVNFCDFEWFSFDNNLADTTFLWLFLHQYPEWQRELISTIVKSENDKDNFRANVIRQILGYGWYNEIAADEKGNKWVQYIRAAGDSFESLIGMK